MRLWGRSKPFSNWFDAGHSSTLSLSLTGEPVTYVQASAKGHRDRVTAVY
jgi:hypothetical protein